MDMTPLPLVEAKLLSPETLAAQIGELPENYRSYLAGLTGASEVWKETSFGAGAMVAVIDSGTDASHPCLSGSGETGLPQRRVIAGPDLSPDAGTEFEGSTSPTNDYHGTFAAGMVASHCFIVLDKRVPEDAELAAVFQDHFPPGTVFATGHNLMVPLIGLAPAASIYAVKVFPHTGSGVASSIINAAVDHIITTKELSNNGLAGGVDVDIINMSLGGASLADGLTLGEQLVDAATRAGMLVVVSAGNQGPAPVSVSSPGTAYTALTAGAASDPAHTRIFWDILFGPGQGAALYSGDDLRPADFSARGPLADRRPGPDVVATGVFNISLTPGGGNRLVIRYVFFRSYCRRRRCPAHGVGQGERTRGRPNCHPQRHHRRRGFDGARMEAKVPGRRLHQRGPFPGPAKGGPHRQFSQVLRSGRDRAQRPLREWRLHRRRGWSGSGEDGGLCL